MLHAPVIQKRIPHGNAFGVEKGHARCFVMEREQIQAGAKFSVIPFFGFFDHVQVDVELLFVKKGDAVQALELFPGLVRPPVGTGGF